MGGKYLLSKQILPIILKDRKPEQWYVEPFVGGFNTMDKVDGNRIAADVHRYLIALFVALRDGWVPPKDVSKEEYHHIKNNQDNYPDELVGFVGFGCSFGGRWFEGCANSKKQRSYSAESYRACLRQGKLIQGVEIIQSSYLDLSIPPDSIIYCDPPYMDTKKYKDSIDHNQFWEWCRYQASLGHQVFVSEQSAPDDFTVVFSKDRKSPLCADNSKAVVISEKLFIPKSQVNNCPL